MKECYFHVLPFYDKEREGGGVKIQIFLKTYILSMPFKGDEVATQDETVIHPSK